MERRLIFINRFFFPDHSATSQILSDLAFHLGKIGREVHVITSRSLYDDPTARLPEEETVRRVRIHRTGAAHFGRGSLAGRAADDTVLLASFARKARALARPSDILVAETDPPLLSIATALATRGKGVLLVNWMQDVYPEIAARLGVGAMSGPIVRGLAVARNAALRRAAANVVIGERMAETVAGLGVRGDRIRVIANWCDDENITPVDRNPLRESWGFEGRFVVGYSGNLGRAHEYRTLIDAADILRDRRDIIFLFIGGGHFCNELRVEVERRGLAERFVFKPYQDASKLKLSLSLPDVHWISLRPELEGLIVPSKFYGIAAAGRPTIAVASPQGEIARLVERHGCGICAPPGAPEQLARAISRLRDDHETRAAMGRAARAMIERHFSRTHGLRQWESLFAELDANKEFAKRRAGDDPETRLLRTRRRSTR